MAKIAYKDLQIGDVVSMGNWEYSSATVKQIKNNVVHFFRPYVQTSDFEHTGGVTCFVGVEEYTVYQDSDRTIELLKRNTKEFL